MSHSPRPLLIFCALWLTLAGAALLSGCSRDDTNSAAGPEGAGATLAPTGAADDIIACPRRGDAPDGLVTVSVFGRPRTFWPYVGRGPSAPADDPVNLVFSGQADPVRIRAALMALDGNRTAFGFPDAFPFNSRWTDAYGDAMATYAEGEAWTGGIIQLQVGDFSPVRVHLRLFRARLPGHGPAECTLGAAHFELLIPGTADHQVLSWELAEQMVVADLVRSGLLDPAAPLAPSGPINAAPGWRTIPVPIYNGLPPELIAAIGGPPAPVGTDVPIATDGQATLLNIRQRAPIVPGRTTQHFTMTYGQVVPKPFCAGGPLDYVLLQGPVTFDKRVVVDRCGNLSVSMSYRGRLTVTPLDVTVDPPAPAGAPYAADVHETQLGSLLGPLNSLVAESGRVGTQAGGSESQSTRLRIGLPGRDFFESSTHCLTPAL